MDISITTKHGDYYCPKSDKNGGRGRNYGSDSSHRSHDQGRSNRPQRTRGGAQRKGKHAAPRERHTPPTRRESHPERADALAALLVTNLSIDEPKSKQVNPSAEEFNSKQPDPSTEESNLKQANSSAEDFNSKQINPSTQETTSKQDNVSAEEAQWKREGESCSICLCAITNKAVLGSCNHEFCEPCIRGWMAISVSGKGTPGASVCPLCKAEFTTILFNYKDDGSHDEDLVAPLFMASSSLDDTAPTSDSTVSADDELMCLDHAYFAGEVTRLLDAAERIHRRLLVERRGQRGASALDEHRWTCVAETIDALYETQRMLAALERFDPHHLLQELYNVQDTIDGLWRTPLTDARGRGLSASGSGGSSRTPQRFSANDAWYRDAGEDGDEAWEQYCDEEAEDEVANQYHYSRTSRPATNVRVTYQARIRTKDPSPKKKW